MRSCIMPIRSNRAPILDRCRTGTLSTIRRSSRHYRPAALLYRRNDVKEASTLYVFAPTREQLFNQVISPKHAVALRTAAEKGKLVIALPQTRELPWLEKSQIPPEAKLITDPQLPLINSHANEAVSNSGELRRNWEDGIYTINTPRTEAGLVLK
jgi:hypothetical protein